MSEDELLSLATNEVDQLEGITGGPCPVAHLDFRWRIPAWLYALSGEACGDAGSGSSALA